ncbi:MAG: hypothetical protein KGH89_08635 [Thaumarchaeota archaeon]|nr:hypothetical protein [Nitrososphaerota archaeon]MDE1867128.1 hypothetical protein [Nitrososphaerota archaeon]
MGLFGKTKQKDKNVEKLSALFDKFDYPHLEKLCADVIKISPRPPGGEHLERIQYLEFVWEQYKKGTVNFQQIEDFAVSQEIIPKDFFE